LTLSRELVDRLSVRTDRLGWEYVEPAAITPSPEAQLAPVWQEPLAPPVPQTRNHPITVGCGLVCLIPGLFYLLIALAIQNGAGIAAGLFYVTLGAGILVGPGLWTKRRVAAANRRHDQVRQSQWAEFQRTYHYWREHVAAHDAAELMRWTTVDRWYPLELRSRPSRIDVFGGTGDGWASLLTTFSAALLRGPGTMVVDFSEQQVSNGLGAVAIDRGVPLTGVELPAQLDLVGLLDRMSGEEVAEMLAAAVSTTRPEANRGDLRVLDAGLFGAVLGRLAGPQTFARLAAGLQVLQRTYDVRADGPLTASEVSAITSVVDSLVHTEQAKQELQFLVGVLEPLARGEAPSEGAPLESWLPGRDVTVIETASPHQRRKDLVDRLVFHRVLHELRNLRRGGSTGTLVLAGADELGITALRELTRQAERAGVFLVLFLHRLDDESQQLLGSSNSASVVMRLGNGREATTAAEFIGREHRFLMNQLTTQVGRTVTEGEANSVGGADSTSRSSGYVSSSGSGPSGSTSSSGYSSSVTRTRSAMWQNTVSYAEALSNVDGQTTSRVYEFAVEPTAIQSLPVTSFILVEPTSTGRRAVLGDCNPGIALLPKVSERPRLT
jgi:hypothetical protein